MQPQGGDSRGKVIVGSECLGVSKFALWYTSGVSFLAKKVHGILLGFSFGLQNGFQGVLYDFHIDIISEIAAFRKI